MPNDEKSASQIARRFFFESAFLDKKAATLLLTIRMPAAVESSRSDAAYGRISIGQFAEEPVRQHCAANIVDNRVDKFEISALMAHRE
ncbi:MAG: hypothetical protein BGP09_04075 [Rhizobium sp. 60-20]|nr:MAG: hypothetical protein BGP09_04075 [Rhizobium sp. 60-20]